MKDKTTPVRRDIGAIRATNKARNMERDRKAKAAAARKKIVRICASPNALPYTTESPAGFELEATLEALFQRAAA